MREGIKAKRPGYIKFYPERWIFGSTREEMTNAERAVWIDFLALAYMNDPPGQIDFTSLRRLANQLNIRTSLLSNTIQKAINNQKIRVIKYVVDQKTNEKLEELDLTFDQIATKNVDLDQSRVKNGIALYTIFILKWSEYQSEYLRQKPYRKKENKPDKTPENLTPKPVTQVTSRGEERREEEIKEEDIRGEEHPKSIVSLDNESYPEHPSLSLKEFFEILGVCAGYPFNEIKDRQFYYLAANSYPRVDLRRQTTRKIEWWLEHPEALSKNPREQLMEFYRTEQVELEKKGAG
ncbi:MAG: hypothetical protein LUQ65_01605 [Candidatus Helarchaeota archaeon]|nr:hypothetical protein [Candidatus Helarchaeota archaeon]